MCNGLRRIVGCPERLLKMGSPGNDDWGPWDAVAAQEWAADAGPSSRADDAEGSAPMTESVGAARASIVRRDAGAGAEAAWRGMEDSDLMRRRRGGRGSGLSFRRRPLFNEVVGEAPVAPPARSRAEILADAREAKRAKREATITTMAEAAGARGSRCGLDGRARLY